MKVLLLAEPFGFGPVGSLLNCKKQLNGNNHQWKYVGADFTKSVVENEDFEGILLLDRNFSIDHPELLEFIDWADIIISGTEYRVDKVLKDQNKTLIIYDPLYWFWPNPPRVDYPNTYYVCMYFTDDNVEEMKLSYQNRIFWAHPPVYKSITNIKKEDWFSSVLINLCGLVNPIKTHDKYYDLILDCLAEIAQLVPWKKIVVTGNEEQLNKIKPRYNNLFQIKSLNHSGMLSTIASSNMVLTAPGLNSVFECMSLNCPVFFLPPQNNSQAYQLEIFQNNNLSSKKMDWNFLTNKDWEWQGKLPEQIFTKIQEAMNYLTNNIEAKDSLKNNLLYYLTLSEQQANSFLQVQSTFFENLYKSNNQTFSDIFNTVLNSVQMTAEA